MCKPLLWNELNIKNIGKEKYEKGERVSRRTWERRGAGPESHHVTL